MATDREQTQDAAGGNQSDNIDPALLMELTRALLPHLGPYSITTVKRAARTTGSANELVRQIAGHVDDIAKREVFMRAAMRILFNFADGQNATPAAEPAVETEATGGRPASPMTPELLQRGQAALAPIIGPLAGVLVTRYGSASKNSREFFERLAGHLRSPEERDSFFISVRTGNGNWRPE